jgi:hypothetical protein
MKKAFLIFIVFIFLFVVLPLRTLDTWMPTDIRLDTGDTAGSSYSTFPQIVCSGNNVYVVWEDHRNGDADIYFNYSTNSGVTWLSSIIRLDTGDTAGANSSWGSQIAYSGNTNNVYVVWQDNRNGADDPDIYFNYSTDGGAHWQSSDIRLDTGDTPGANKSDCPQIAYSGNNVYAVWQDDRDGLNDIYFNYSTDSGVTWQSLDNRLDTGDTAGANNSKYSQITCYGNTVYAVWQDNRNGADDIYFNYSTDSGVTWQSSDIRLDTGDTAGADNSIWPQIACSGNNVYVVWQDHRNGAAVPDIYFNYSTDGGANWQSSDIRLDTGDTPGSNYSFYPQITCSGNNVYVVWQDSRNGSEDIDDIYFNYSTNNGAIWQSSDIRLDTGDTAGANNSKYPQITCYGNNVYVVWQDERNGNDDIYFNYSIDGGADWQSSDIRLDIGDTAGASYSGFPKVASSETNVGAVWVDSRNGNYDIYFNRAIPWTNINANGSNGPLTITTMDTLQIRISLNTNGLTANADFWLVYKGPSGWYYFDYSSKKWLPGLDVTYQGALFDLDSKKVFQSSGLSPGTYRFYFGVDLNMDGTVTKISLYYDEVKVTVTQ